MMLEPVKPLFASKTLEIPERVSVRARGSLTVSCQCDLLVTNSSFGAYRLDGSLVRDTLRVWGNGQYPDIQGKLAPEHLPPGSNVVKTVDQPVLWGGGISDHYGHFLTEFVARLWPLLPDGPVNGLPVVYCGLRKWQFVRDWLNAFGVQTVKLPDDGVVRFRKVYVPEPAWQLDRWVAPEMRAIHLQARHGMQIPNRESRSFLWLSRSLLGRSRVPYDEALFEWLMSKVMTIVNPEVLTLGEQVAAFETSRAVAGVVGSAFHTALLAEDTPMCVFLCPSGVPAPFVLQNELLPGNSVFLHSLTPTAMPVLPQARRPASFRLMIPETVRALAKTMLPDLLSSDPLLKAIASPELLWSKGNGRTVQAGGVELEVAVARVLLDPLSITSRMRLGALFEAEGVENCALEQFLTVAELANEYALAPLCAARILHRGGRLDEAAEMAKRALAANSELKEATDYLTKSSD